MTIESKKDLPKRYQEIADEAGFKAVLDSLDKSPADMTAVAEVEKRVEDLQEVIESSNLDYGSLDWELRTLSYRLDRYSMRNSSYGTYSYPVPEASGTSVFALVLAIGALILGVIAILF